MAEQERIDEETVAIQAAPDDAPLVADELVIEDVSIDGMCGVY